MFLGCCYVEGREKREANACAHLPFGVRALGCYRREGRVGVCLSMMT